MPQSISIQPGDLYLTFPRVIVLDSLTALFEDEHELSGMTARQFLARTLHTFRRLGVCVFLVGGIEDCKDQGLAYLVDNVFMLDILNLERGEARNLPVRVLSVRKTRFQTSDRGQHTFHLSRSTGCGVSPSLHSVLRSLKNRDLLLSDPAKKAVIWAYNPKQQRRPSPARDIQISSDPVLIRNRSQCLAYGGGSAGKAKFGLMLAFEPRVPVEPQDTFKAYVASHWDRQRDLHYVERIHVDSARVLVISFLYNSEYYEDLATDLLQQRFHISKREAAARVKAQIGILAFYPGLIDGETIVGFVRQRIREARFEGMPYTA
ncbi:MAG: ATPase domain-containing protein, partial [Pyrinomonadaceae bacterium]